MPDPHPDSNSSLMVADKIYTQNCLPANVQDDHRFDHYIQILKDQGLKISHRLRCGTF